MIAVFSMFSSSLRHAGLVACACLALTACDTPEGPDHEAESIDFRASHKPIDVNRGAYNFHLANTVRFNPTPPGSDAEHGRARFGVAADLINEDTTEALFEGESAVAGGAVESNGRTCFTCHRGTDHDFGLPTPPLSDTIDLEDSLFTGIDADAQGDPDAEFNLDQLGLFKIRPNRFNPTRDGDDPFRQVFGWRKSPPLVDIAFTHGILTDLRARTIFETARGAVFSHTQTADNRFDDLFAQEDGDGMAAFLFEQVSDPALLALRDPSHPDYDTLVNDPFATVPVSTKDERKGKKLFKKFCFACHDTPNVFNSLANVEAVGAGNRPTSFPTFAPAIGRGFNIGVAEANMNDLRFTRDNGDGTFTPIVLPLAAEDGTLVEHEVQFDVGLAATTAREDDIGRFKSPALRNVSQHAPYFHDNSIDTLEGVVDYFCSDEYNNSKDGQQFPIHMNATQRQQLVAFLELL